MNQKRPARNRPGRFTLHPVKSLEYLLAALLLACLGTVFAIDGADDQTVLQGLQASSDQFSTFLSMVEEAGLTETLQGAGPITVLAPTNAAFEDLDEAVVSELRSGPEQMTSFVNGLILSDAYELNELQDAAEGSLAPLSGEAYEVETTAGGLTVNGVGFDATDVNNVFSNGVVHVTNGVVLPQALRGLADVAADEDADGTPPATDATDATDATGATDPAGTPGAPGATGPATPAVPPAAPGAPPAAPGAAVPATPAPVEPTTAFVRVVQLSPATSVNVVLTPQDEGLSELDLGALEYAAASDYSEVQPGTYLITATMADSQDALFEPPSETFRAGNYYTVAVMGLQVPADDAAAAEAEGAEGEGFGGWLRDLFGGDADRDALAMKATTYQDDVRLDADATETRVRFIDAAPGSPAFDVVAINAAGERDVIADDMTYGNDSGAETLADDVTALQVTAADSTAVALDLTDRMPLPTDATIFLIGTTFEGAPFDVLVLPNGAAAAPGTTDAQSGTTDDGSGTTDDQ